MIIPTTNSKATVLPITFSASSLFPSPNLIDTLVLPPTAMATQNTPNMVNSGIVIPSPDIAKAPTFFIDPINALSTVLYNEVTIIASIAGTEYLTNSLLILPFLNAS